MELHYTYYVTLGVRGGKNGRFCEFNCGLGSVITMILNKLWLQFNYGDLHWTLNPLLCSSCWIVHWTSKSRPFTLKDPNFLLKSQGLYFLVLLLGRGARQLAHNSICLGFVLFFFLHIYHVFFPCAFCTCNNNMTIYNQNIYFRKYNQCTWNTLINTSSDNTGVMQENES